MLGGEGELRRQIHQALTTSGSTVLLLDQDPARPGDEEHLRLARELDSGQVDCLLFLDGLASEAPDEFENPEQFEAQVLGPVYRLVHLVQALVASRVTRPIDILLVGRNTYLVTEDEPRLDPKGALLAGIGKVIGQEYPNLSCRFVDLDAADTGPDTAAAVGEELDWAFAGRDSGIFQVARRHQTRFVEQLCAAPAVKPSSQAPITIREDGVYLLTGGLGGIGLAVANWLGSLAPVRLALLGRTPLPARDSWPDYLAGTGDTEICHAIRTISSLEQTGHQVLVLAADVADPGQLGPALAEIHQRLGRINGIFHSAGVAGDGFLFNKPLARFAEVLAPKVRGTWLLDRLTRDDAPDFLVAFSSQTALTGAPGQSDYTAANAYLDAHCALRNRQGLSTITINWPAWLETGMAFARQRETPGFERHAITTAAGLQALGQVLATPSGQVIVGGALASALFPAGVAPFRLAPDLASLAPAPAAAADEEPPQQGPTAHATDTGITISGRRDNAYPRVELELAKIWAENLGHGSISIHDSFFDLGGDSINAMQIRNSIATAFAVDISIADIFDHSSIAESAAFLAGKLAVAGTEALAGTEGPPVKPVERQSSYPVSSAQRRLYFLWQLARETSGYNLPQVILLPGAPDVARLRSAFQTLVARHEVLRTCFAMPDEEPVQIVRDSVDLAIRQVTVAEAELEEHARRFVQPFDLTRAPLLRVELAALDSGRHALLTDIHHIVADAMSMEILARELGALYRGEDLPEPDLQYRDFAVWQRQQLGDNALATQREYWQDQFSDGAPVLSLPVDAPRPPLQTYQGEVVNFNISQELLDQVRTLAAAHQATPFMVFLAALFILLHRLSGQDDLVIAVMDSGRVRPELENLLGMFVNNLPVRARPRDELGIGDFLVEVRTLARLAQANQDYPFDELVGELDLPRDLSRNPLADVVFSYMSFAQAETLGAGQPETGQPETGLATLQGALKSSSKFDMTLFAREHAGGVGFSLEYYSAIFKRASMERFCSHLIRVVEQIVANSERPLAELDLLSAAQRRQVLDDYNRQALSTPPSTTLAARLRQRARQAAAGEALVDNHGQRWTYSELHQRANQIAHHLQGLGVGPEVLVGLCMERTAEMVAAVIGILAAGGAYVPLDPTYPAQRLAFIIDEAGCPVVLTQASLVATLPASDPASGASQGILQAFPAI